MYDHLMDIHMLFDHAQAGIWKVGIKIFSEFYVIVWKVCLDCTEVNVIPGICELEHFTIVDVWSAETV